MNLLNFSEVSGNLGHYLQERNVNELFICGLATDYCVKYSTLDSTGLGIRTSVIEDACRGVNLRPDDSTTAIAEMRKAGAFIINSADLGR